MPIPSSTVTRTRLHMRRIAPGYRKIVGLNLVRGFRLTVAEMFDTASETVRRYYPRWYRGDS